MEDLQLQKCVLEGDQISVLILLTVVVWVCEGVCVCEGSVRESPTTSTPHTRQKYRGMLEEEEDEEEDGKVDLIPFLSFLAPLETSGRSIRGRSSLWCPQNQTCMYIP